MAAPVEVRGLSNTFGRQIVHLNLELTVEEGEIFGIVGGSGAGKSVLLRSILGLQKPRAGSVKLYGRDITRMSSAELRTVKAGYGVTFQEGALFSALTVLQNIQLPMIEHLHLPRRTLDELAMLKLKLVGLRPDAAGKFPAQLSGGMVKRAALARALALDPPLLFLDEPTSGLDPIGAQAFDDLVKNLQRQLNLTVVMITHDLDTLFGICTRVGVLVDGRMISDTLANISRSPQPWIHAYFQGPRAQRRRVDHGA
jgi:phospholipid/cholesterol/gamma-HCH transport system ATP-binding protein